MCMTIHSCIVIVEKRQDQSQPMLACVVINAVGMHSDKARLHDFML